MSQWGGFFSFFFFSFFTLGFLALSEEPSCFLQPAACFFPSASESLELLLLESEELPGPCFGL